MLVCHLSIFRVRLQRALSLNVALLRRADAVGRI
jgi:hypothetical protein